MEQICHNCGKTVELVALGRHNCACPRCGALFARPAKVKQDNQPKAPVEPKPKEPVLEPKEPVEPKEPKRITKKKEPSKPKETSKPKEPVLEQKEPKEPVEQKEPKLSFKQTGTSNANVSFKPAEVTEDLVLDVVEETTATAKNKAK